MSGVGAGFRSIASPSSFAVAENRPDSGQAMPAGAQEALGSSADPTSARRDRRRGFDSESLLGLLLDAVRLFLGFDAVRDIAPGAALFLLPLLHRSGLRRFLVLRAGDVYGLDRHLVRVPRGIGHILVERHLDRLLDRLTLAFDVGEFDDADQMMVAVYNRQAADVVLGHQLPRLLHALVLEAADHFQRHQVARPCRLGILRFRYAAHNNVPVGNHADESVTFDNRYEADRNLAHAMRQLAKRRFRLGGLDICYENFAYLHVHTIPLTRRSPT